MTENGDIVDAAKRAFQNSQRPDGLFPTFDQRMQDAVAAVQRHIAAEIDRMDEPYFEGDDPRDGWSWAQTEAAKIARKGLS